MSAALKNFRLSFSTRLLLFVVLAVGLIGLRVLYLESPERAWLHILIGSTMFLGFSLCGLFFTSIQFLTSARWSVVLRRIMEAMSLTLPVAVLLFIPILFGIHHIYEWSHAEAVANDELLQWKSGYLSSGFFSLRLMIYFTCWIVLSILLVRNSFKQDDSGDANLSTKNFKISAIGLVVFALSVTMGAFDIIMSLEPHWFSTIFGVYFFAGFFQAGLALIYILTWMVYRAGVFDGFVTKDHFHDIGRFLFGFSVFWAYIAFSQFMLIWYGDLPEETFIYRDRFNHGWEWLSLALLCIRFLIPFFVLMPFAAKRCFGTAIAISFLVLAGQWIDLFWFAIPSLRLSLGVESIPFSLNWTEVSIGLGYLSLFVLSVTWIMERIRMVPIKDPRLEASVHYYHHG